MAYQVFALKYRPRTFDQVVGQKATVTTLRNALTERRIAHGYIFAGVRGVGKTTMARLFAKALNCASGPTPEPCGQCDSCREVAEGRSLDVFEIDGASNSGVDKMRDLLETVRYSPARDRYKVFIIDEFHQISRAAFNALLKTLEEPPPHVVFVMATTELGKVIPTILSRCQVFEFRRIPASEIAGQLRQIAEREGITIEDRTLALLAGSAGGSMRDALTAMDQVIAACGEHVADDDARSILGVIPQEEIESFFEALAGGDAQALLRLIARVTEAGYDLVAFGAEIYHMARRLLIARTMTDAGAILDLSSDELERSLRLTRRFGEDDLQRILHIIEDMQPGLRYSTQPRYLLEATSVRLARLGELAPIEEILSRLDALGIGGGASAPARPVAAARPRTSPAPPAPAGRPTHTPRPSEDATAEKKKSGRDDPFAQTDRSVNVPAADETTDAGTPAVDLPAEAGLFERVLARLEGENSRLASILGMAVEPREADGVLLLPLPLERSFSWKRSLEPANLSHIAALASEIAGRSVEVRVVPAGGAAREALATGVAPIAAMKETAVTGRAMSDPIVKTVVDLFHARVVGVEEKR